MLTDIFCVDFLRHSLVCIKLAELESYDMSGGKEI